MFANPLMASATMDRLVHRAVKIGIQGKSYRMDSFVRRSAGSYFLFGPRGTGKSTWLRARYPDAA